MSTTKNEGARAMTCPDPDTPAHNHEREEGTLRSVTHRTKRRKVPEGALKVPGVAGRVLIFLWSMAPWSQGPVAFVWPRLATIEAALDLWPSQVTKAIHKLKAAGWIRRETRTVRFEGRPVDRFGLVLNERPSDGPLFERVEQEGDDGEVVVPTPPRVVDPSPLRVVSPSLEEQEPNKNSSSARAREAWEPPVVEEDVGEREPGDDDPDAVGSGRPTPPPPPRPRPPSPEPPPAALERELWDTAERERTESLGGTPRPATAEREAQARRLLEHVQRDERCDEQAAAARVRQFLAAACAFARRKRSEGQHSYAARRIGDPFSTKAYDHVMAFEQAKPPRPRTREEAIAAWRAREWQPDDERRLCT